MNARRSRMSGVLAPLILLGTLNLLVFRDPMLDIFRTATKRPEGLYVLMVPLLAVYLAWLRQSRLGRYEIRRSFAGPVLILSGWLLFVGGAFYDVVLFWHLGGIVGFIGVVVTCVGPRILLVFGPAFLVLFAIAPLPGVVREWIALPLQNFATIVTSIILELLGVDAVRRGSIIEINGKIVLVGEACNGMRLVMPIALVIYAVVFSLPLRRAARDDRPSRRAPRPARVRPRGPRRRERSAQRGPRRVPSSARSRREAAMRLRVSRVTAEQRRGSRRCGPSRTLTTKRRGRGCAP